MCEIYVRGMYYRNLQIILALSYSLPVFFFFQAEDGIRDLVRSRGLGDVYKRQIEHHLDFVTGAEPRPGEIVPNDRESAKTWRDLVAVSIHI